VWSKDSGNPKPKGRQVGEISHFLSTKLKLKVLQSYEVLNTKDPKREAERGKKTQASNKKENTT